MESEVSPAIVELEETVLQPSTPVTVETYIFPLPLENISLEDGDEEAPANSASISLGHSTAAHKLMKTWPSIAPFFQDVIRPD